MAQFQRTAQVKAQLAAIPRERFVGKAVRTFFGLLFVGLGVAMVWLALSELHHSHTTVDRWLLGGGVGAMVLGATIWSSELVLAPLKLLLAFAGDVLAMVRGSKPPATP